MSRFLLAAESSIIPVPSRADAVAVSREQTPPYPARTPRKRLTFTGIIGAICWFPLNAIIRLCVMLRIHPNILTLIGVLINVAAGIALAARRFVLAGVVMIVANIFYFIDGKVAHQLHLE